MPVHARRVLLRFSSPFWLCVCPRVSTRRPHRRQRWVSARTLTASFRGWSGPPSLHTMSPLDSGHPSCDATNGHAPQPLESLIYYTCCQRRSLLIMFSLLPLALLPLALAAPQPQYASPIHVPILRRSTTHAQRIARMPQIMDSIRTKYGYKPRIQKRSTTTASITDEVCPFQVLPTRPHRTWQGNDSSYSGVVSIGTPYVPSFFRFLVSLPTGPQSTKFRLDS